MLGQAGINIELFTAHSIRSASTSKAAATVSTDVIKPAAVTNQMNLSVHE